MRRAKVRRTATRRALEAEPASGERLPHGEQHDAGLVDLLHALAAEGGLHLITGDVAAHVPCVCRDRRVFVARGAVLGPHARVIDGSLCIDVEVVDGGAECMEIVPRLHP